MLLGRTTLALVLLLLPICLKGQGQRVLCAKAPCGPVDRLTGRPLDSANWETVEEVPKTTAEAIDTSGDVNDFVQRYSAGLKSWQKANAPLEENEDEFGLELDFNKMLFLGSHGICLGLLSESSALEGSRLASDWLDRVGRFYQTGDWLRVSTKGFWGIDLEEEGGLFSRWLALPADSTSDEYKAEARAIELDVKERIGRTTNAEGASLKVSPANLVASNLAGASLIEANFKAANLFRANLIGANLLGADFTGASLREANLLGANLFGADLSNADLTGANLFGANLEGTWFDAGTILDCTGHVICNETANGE